MSFDASLPSPYAQDLATALSIVNKDGLGAASYQAPGGEALPFVLAKVAVSGGQEVDTVGYPFFGGWSSEALNEKVQSLEVEGFLIGGADLIARRNKLMEAFRKKTSDDAPGYIALPSWGRFPVLVPDWNVSEELDKQGRYAIKLSLSRAGLSEAARQTAAANTGATHAAALAKASAAAQANFIATLTEENLSTSTMGSGFGALAGKLLAVVGRVQGIQSKINSLTNSVLGITNLVSQGIFAPRDLAASLFGAVVAITTGVLGVAVDLASLFDEEEEGIEGEDRNILNVSTAFLANASFLLDVPAATARDLTTRTAIQNLYRAASLYGAAALLPTVGGVSADKMEGLFGLLLTLEESIDRNDPDLAAACAELRIAVAAELDALELYRERTRLLSLPVPALVLASELGISYSRLMSLNLDIEDSFLVRGEVTYV